MDSDVDRHPILVSSGATPGSSPTNLPVDDRTDLRLADPDRVNRLKQAWRLRTHCNSKTRGTRTDRR